MQQRPPRQRLSSNALVFTDFHWVDFHLNEKSPCRQLDRGVRSFRRLRANLREAGYTGTWIDQSIWLDAVSFRTTRPPREVDRAYSQEGMSKACNLNPSHRKVCLASRLFLYRGRHLSRSRPRLKRLEHRTKSRPIFRQHVFHLGWHFRIYLAVNHAIFFQVT